MNLSSQYKVTVYPSVAGVFPPASFWIAGESYRYMRELQNQVVACGLCECPADSYFKHLPDTFRPH